MALRGRFGQWTRPTYTVPTAPITLAGTATPGTTTTSSVRTSGAPKGQFPNRDWYEDPTHPWVQEPWKLKGNIAPNVLEEFPWMKRQPGDRPPSMFEFDNPWAYNPKMEPIIGPNGETPKTWHEYYMAGMIPPAGTQQAKDFADNLGSTDPQELMSRGVTNVLGQAMIPAPTGLQEAPKNIPGSGAFFGYIDNITGQYYPNGKWMIDPKIATSGANFPAVNKEGVPDNPNFQWTKNPPTWTIPATGETVRSIPGSSNIVGFNPETGMMNPETPTPRTPTPRTQPPITQVPLTPSPNISTPRMTAL